MSQGEKRTVEQERKYTQFVCMDLLENRHMLMIHQFKYVSTREERGNSCANPQSACWKLCAGSPSKEGQSPELRATLQRRLDRERESCWETESSIFCQPQRAIGTRWTATLHAEFSHIFLYACVGGTNFKSTRKKTMYSIWFENIISERLLGRVQFLHGRMLMKWYFTKKSSRLPHGQQEAY